MAPDPTLPPFALFPGSAASLDAVGSVTWSACLASWLLLSRAHLAYSDAEFAALSLQDESLQVVPFLVGFVHAYALQGPLFLGKEEEEEGDASASTAEQLCQAVLLLTSRAWRQQKPQQLSALAGGALTRWEFAADVCRAYGLRRAGHVLQSLSLDAADRLEGSLSGLKKVVARNLDLGSRGDLGLVETQLSRVNHLLGAWPAAAVVFLAGSDYTDALVAGYGATTHPPLRQCIVTHLYLCLVGFLRLSRLGAPPRYAQLTDVLYSLRAAAEEHKKSSSSSSKNAHKAHDSLVGDLVSTTPLIALLQKRAEASSGGPSSHRLHLVLTDLVKFRRGGDRLCVPPGRRKVRHDKGKAPAREAGGAASLVAHPWTQISQIQDLFPDLGSAFVVQLLDAFDQDTEKVVAHLLEGTLPPHLDKADRSENLSGDASDSRADRHHHHTSLAPHATPPLLATRREEEASAAQPGGDDDELLSLVADTSRLHFGKQRSARTADDVLRDRSQAPPKAAILSALAAFDSDDDERDDTYDAADVGGAVVDSSLAPGGGDDLADARDDVLFAAYQNAPQVFGRDAATRRSEARARLRDDTGMADEAIEGWAVMLGRNPQQRRRLEAKLNTFTGAQTELTRTAWRADADDEDEDGGGGGGPSRGGRGVGRGGGFRGGGRGGGGGGGGGGRGGNVAGPSGEKETEQARRRKEASKSSRANHNRRDQRARKMARGGFPG